MRIIIPYKPREQFKEYHNTNKRYRCLLCHRQFGKTVGIINHLIRQATTDPEDLAKGRNLTYTQRNLVEWRSMPRMFGYLAPYLTQAKSIAWEKLKYYAGVIPGVTFNETELRADFPGGGRIRLFGADNAEALRGLMVWEWVLDEFQDHFPDMWKTVLSPTMIHTQAPVTFVGTIKGEDHLWELHEKAQNNDEWFSLYLPASKTGVLSPDFLVTERRIIGDAMYNQEYELEPLAAIVGAIFGDEMCWLFEHKHIIPLEIEPYVPINTYWDLGINDYTVVLFTQELHNEIRIVDCMMRFGISLLDISKEVKAKDYLYGQHYFPHDAKIRDLTTGITRVDAAKQILGSNVDIIPRVAQKEDGIEAFKAHHKKFFIDAKLKDFIKALQHYQREFDEKQRVFKTAPKHNWASHYVDSLLGISQRLQTNLFSSLPNNTMGGIVIPEPHFIDDGGLII